MPCYFQKTHLCLQVADAVSAKLLYSSQQLSTPHIPTVLPRPGAVHQFSLQGGDTSLKSQSQREETAMKLKHT